MLLAFEHFIAFVACGHVWFAATGIHWSRWRRWRGWYHCMWPCILAGILFGFYYWHFCDCWLNNGCKSLRSCWRSSGWFTLDHSYIATEMIYIKTKLSSANQIWNEKCMHTTSRCCCAGRRRRQRRELEYLWFGIWFGRIHADFVRKWFVWFNFYSLECDSRRFRHRQCNWRWHTLNDENRRIRQI